MPQNVFLTKKGDVRLGDCDGEIEIDINIDIDIDR